MVKSEQQRQRKLAKKKLKEREKQGQLARQKAQLSSMAGLVAAASGPVSVCMVSEACTDGTGIGSVLIARRIPRGQTVMVIFLLDMYCLGVKDVVFRSGGPADLRLLIEKMNSMAKLHPLAPGECRSLVESAVAYAEGLGLQPHGDYRKVFGIFEGIEPLPLPERFKFGRDGKPMYVNGPYDTPARMKLILNTLANTVGEGNYHFTIGGPSLNGNPFEGLVDLIDGNCDNDPEEEFENDESSNGVIEGRVVNRLPDSMSRDFAK